MIPVKPTAGTSGISGRLERENPTPNSAEQTQQRVKDGEEADEQMAGNIEAGVSVGETILDLALTALSFIPGVGAGATGAKGAKEGVKVAVEGAKGAVKAGAEVAKEAVTEVAKAGVIAAKEAAKTAVQEGVKTARKVLSTTKAVVSGVGHGVAAAKRKDVHGAVKSAANVAETLINLIPKK